eukprot:1187626-Prorocentrum_minimum.AAC.2
MSPAEVGVRYHSWVREVKLLQFKLRGKRVENSRPRGDFIRRRVGNGCQRCNRPSTSYVAFFVFGITQEAVSCKKR